MGSTTLYTFLFEHPTRVQTVELLGSWDNFSKPYQLQRDRRRGRGIWSGCYTFDNIICDGDLKNTGQRRSGALKTGGTYWYYYNVDGEERHNPSEPSTTVCPLLPGQQLNVLEVPSEAENCPSMETPDVFTRNPKDRFLTPVPPVTSKPLPSPRLGDLCREPYTVPTVSLTTPRSATYPYSTPAYSPGYVRHARSASSTPAVTSTALFADFKCLKEKFAQKRSASHARAGSRNIRHLEIGAPTLISTTAEEVNLVPLSALQRTPGYSPLPTPQTSRSLPTPTIPQTSISLPSAVRAKFKEFSPLGSHPVDVSPVVHQTLLSPAIPEEEQSNVRPRSRSDVVPFPSGSCVPANLIRANSTDTRRTKLFSNEPWISSPRLPKHPEVDSEVVAERLVTAPVLERPTLAVNTPSMDVRPTSSHGGDRSSGLRNTALDKDKQLPPLPRYLVPAPLYACSTASSSPTLQCEPEHPKFEEIQVEDTRFEMLSERKGHFSIWSSESGALSSPTSDDEDIHSPTFSSLTSECSESGSPTRYSLFSISDYIHSPNRESAFIEDASDEDKQDEDHVPEYEIPDSPPKLGELQLSSFGPSLFNLDIQHADSAPRRQAACFGFGFGFQSYKLPDDETESKTTLVEPAIHTQSAIHHGRGNSVSNAEKLVDDFGFLGDAVI